MNRFIILDEKGVMLNRIATDAEFIIYAGYGKYVAYEGEEDIPVIITEEPWDYLSVKPDISMCQGDIMDITTGEVTRYIPPELPTEPFLELSSENYVEGLS